MKRALIAVLNLPAVVLPLAFAAMTAGEPLAGPGLRAMTFDADCRRKAVFSDGQMHCHEEGANCIIVCPPQT